MHGQETTVDPRPNNDSDRCSAAWMQLILDQLHIWIEAFPLINPLVIDHDTQLILDFRKIAIAEAVDLCESKHRTFANFFI